MTTEGQPAGGEEEKSIYQRFAIKRIVAAVLLCVALLWALAVGLGYVQRPTTLTQRHRSFKAGQAAPPASGPSLPMEAEKAPDTGPEGVHGPVATSDDNRPSSSHVQEKQPEAAPPSAEDLSGQGKLSAEPVSVHQAVETTEKKAAHTQPTAAAHGKDVVPADRPVGVAFVEAAIAPLNHELRERFWGWRPNDILDFTDNVNNFQLGVLEVTRRTAVNLTERISRTGATDALDPHLENAMNWFMIKANRYWFPSAESKYKTGLEELEAYKEKLIQGRASFHTRTDNLIPLLAAYEDLLGSCDENLVKAVEQDGQPVSFFKADDYFYYAKGVASAMLEVLKAVAVDFRQTIEGRHGTELLHHAIESCRRAAGLEPWIVFNADLDGILANHRANMAAPISHARFYLGQLIKTLST